MVVPSLLLRQPSGNPTTHTPLRLERIYTGSTVPDGMVAREIDKIGYHGFKTFNLELQDVRIPLDELKYWSVDLQEAYAVPSAVLQRHFPGALKAQG